MSMLISVAIVIITVIAMEVFAWWAHKYIMHGWGWNWHKSHHVVTPGYFEKNDLYSVVFSVFAASLFIIGSLYSSTIWYIALGITIYGLLYAFVHDGLVHQRWPFRVAPRNKYLKRLVHAHRIHHHTTTKDGAVSFGFLWAEDPKKLKAELQAKKA